MRNTGAYARGMHALEVEGEVGLFGQKGVERDSPVIIMILQGTLNAVINSVYIFSIGYYR